jgi:hypothetical protein
VLLPGLRARIHRHVALHRITCFEQQIGHSSEASLLSSDISRHAPYHAHSSDAFERASRLPDFCAGRIAEKSRDGEDRIELIGCGVVCFIKVSKPVAVFGLN